MRATKRPITVALVAALLVLLGTAAQAAPSGTIAVAAGSDLSLGGHVTFDTTWDGVHGPIAPRIEVLCYQDDTLVYGEAISADPAYNLSLMGWDGVFLGGGGSTWLTVGGPAECVANLFIFDKVKGEQTYVLLGSVEFDAEG